MNFLGHFYLDESLGSPWFMAGAASPDLMSVYGGHHRLRPGMLKRISWTPKGAEKPFIAGIHRHFDTDAWFHQSPIFHDQVHALAAMIRKDFPGLNLRHPSFIGHILFELVLDKVLLEDIPGLCDRFYAAWHTIDSDRIQEISRRITGYPMEGYDSYVRQFRERAYLYRYADTSHIEMVLHRILHRVHLEDSPDIPDSVLMILIAACETEARRVYPELFRCMRAGLGAPSW